MVPNTWVCGVAMLCNGSRVDNLHDVWTVICGLSVDSNDFTGLLQVENSNYAGDYL
jgi:hypothetical protein